LFNFLYQNALFFNKPHFKQLGVDDEVKDTITDYDGGEYPPITSAFGLMGVALMLRKKDDGAKSVAQDFANFLIAAGVGTEVPTIVYHVCTKLKIFFPDFCDLAEYENPEPEKQPPKAKGKKTKT